MNSSPGKQSAPSTSLEQVIAEHGREVASDEEPISSELEDRLDKIELLIEQLGQTASLASEFNQYIGDMRREVVSIRRIRFSLLVLTIAFILGINFASYFLVFHHGIIFAVEDTYFKTATFLGALTASVVLLSIMLKGAFHSLAERNKDEMLPPHLKEGIDAAKMMLGK